MANKDAQFTLDITASRNQIPALDTPQIVYLLAEILPPEESSTSGESNLPLNLSLVIDRSTSMKGMRLNRVKKAAELIIDKLSNRDSVSVISYSDRADVVVPSTRVDDKLAIHSKIRSVLASGGTEIFQGLSAGWNEIGKLPLDKHVNHIILLTDGHTYGDVEDCLKLADDTAARGVGISAFGIGHEWNDEFLDELVQPSGGQTGFISDPEQILHFLRQRISGLGTIHAQSVRLKALLPMGITIRDAFKLSPFAQPLKFEKQQILLGAIEGRAPLTALLEVAVEPQPIGQTLTLPFEMRAVLPTDTKQEISLKRNFKLWVSDMPPKERMPERIMRAVQILNMYRMNEQVWKDAENGDLAAATKRMEYLTSRLREAGFTQLAQKAQAETHRMNFTGQLSGEGRKQIRYGTRTIMTESLSLDFDKQKRD
jgi:Ca-activated chloride channel family protein